MSTNKKIDINTIEYLSFEGGGGKGLVYLGAIQALEEKLRGQIGRSIINIEEDLEDRKIKGISGASAGAITAFMLAMGMSSEEIEEEIKKLEVGNPTQLHKTYNLVIEDFGLLSLSGLNGAETFLDDANMSNRFVTKTKRVFNYETLRNYFNKENYIAEAIQNFTIPKSGVLNNQVLQKLFFADPRGRLLNNNDNIGGAYLNSLLYHRGLFPGLLVRKFFKKMIDKYLIQKVKKQRNINLPKPDNLTFYDFFKYTGVDLVVTGVNISQQRSLYFSTYHTPDFPIIEAVAISMNIPIVFKPIYVDYKVDRGRDDNYNLYYKGLFGDGGMLNNFPIHAFNDLKQKRVEFKDQKVNYKLSGTTYNSDVDFNQKTIGFLLGDDIANDIPLPRAFNEEFPALENVSINQLTSYLGDLFKTFMSSGSKGRIRNAIENSYTIELNTEGMDILDFAHYDNDQFRSNVIKKNLYGLRNLKLKKELLSIADEFMDKSQIKVLRIEEAKNKVCDIISN